MIKVTGTLAVRTINGRHGPFNVGRLETELGEFSVKDADLDQYAVGRYDGEFGIEKIYPTSYVFHGSMTIEVRAILGSMVLAGAEALSHEDDQAAREPDPIDEVPPLTVVPATEPAVEASKGDKDTLEVDPEPATTPESPPPTKAPSDPEQAPETEGDDAEARALFGTLWPLGEQVKLDSTVDRKILREQIAWLKTHGYDWKLKGQIWVKAS